MPETMFLNRSKYYFCLMLLLASNIISRSQIGGLGGALLNVTFGQGTTDDISVTGSPLQIGYTAFEYSSDACPPEGQYAVVSGIPQDCSDNSLIDMFADNTPFPDNNGYMMLLNDVPHANAKILFEYNISACYDVDYQFSAAFINIDKRNSSRCTRFSSFTLEVRDAADNLVASTSTGDIQFAIYSMGWHFAKKFVNFRVPFGTALPLTVRIIDEPKAAAPCHNFVAIDDINVVVTGSRVNIGFDATPVGFWVKSSCFQDNKSYTMNGTVETTVANPAVQWTQSTDDGITWRDIPGATGYTLTQNFPVSDTFLFRLRAADLSLISYPGCGVTSDVLKVQVDGLPSFYNATNNSPVCAGNEIKFDAEGGTTYEWHGPNGFYDNIKFPGIFNSELKDSGWYYTQIITAGGCRITDSTYVRVIGTDVKAGNDTVICVGTAAILTASDGATWSWKPSTALSSVNIRKPLASPTETTNYTVAVTDEYGCSGTAEVTVAVKNKEKVSANFSSSKYICRLSDSIFFANRSTGIIDKWQWDFGDGRTSTEQSPPVLYYNNLPANILNYTVRLIVTDTAGCSDEISQTLQLEDMCNMAVPSAFTPNGDGINDYFWPLNAFKAENITFVIFNRKGNKIFETRNWPDKWDGTFKGEPQDPGTYVWVFEYTDTIGKKQVLKGTIILLR